MAQQDTSPIKEKIIYTLRVRGPSLLVHIAKGIEMDMLFTSAFLSELISEKKIKMSHMRIGSSPAYFLQGQETRIEKFSEYLKPKEKEAFEILKNKKIIKDSEQDPAIRVALRAIKDFAIPFQRDNNLFWRFFTIPESEFKQKEIKQIEKEKVIEEIKPKEIIEQELQIPEQKKVLDIFSPKRISAGEKKPKKEIKTKTKKKPEKKQSNKVNEKFFHKVKEFLLKKSIEISSIEGFSKNDLTLKINQQEKEYLLIAYNKKRIDEKDIIKAHKKAKEINLPYKIVCLGEQTKKLTEFIEAIQDLKGIGKIE